MISDLYTWRVLYRDGEIIREEDVDSFTRVDKTRVMSLFFLPIQGGAAHCVNVPEKAHAVLFRRRSIEISTTGEETGKRYTTHCIGWQTEKQASYLFILDDGSTLLSSDLNAI